MKQFSLEKYLANPSIKVVTRDGRRVRVICTDMKSITYPVVALIENGSGYEQLITFSKNGEYEVNESNINDLFFASEKHEGFINIFRDISGHTYISSYIYKSREGAKEACITNNYLTTTKIEWED